MKWLVSGKLTSKGQITLPKVVRQKLKVEEGDLISFSQDDKGMIYLEKVKQGQHCSLCENGYISIHFKHQADFCPICKGTKLIQAHSIEEWLRLGIDAAFQFDMKCTVEKEFGFYLIMFDTIPISPDKSLIEKTHDLVQIGLIREQLNALSQYQLQYLDISNLFSSFEKRLLSSQGKTILKQLQDYVNRQQKIYLEGQVQSNE